MYYYMSSEEVVKHFASSVDRGLSAREAEFRISKFGKNRLVAKQKVTLFQHIWEQFTELMILILIGAGIIAAILGETLDAAIIFFVITINVIIGVLQEHKAEKAIDALNKMMTPHATVLRDGKEQMINAEDLVPGDIVIIEEGTRVPADARIIEAAMLKADRRS